MTPAIRARGLTRRFGDFTAVDRLSFDVQAGEIWGFLGPNGAGKSTTIRMLCGIIAPSEGTAEILGHDVSREPETVKAAIGYMSQRFSLWGDLTVRENLRFYAGVYGLQGGEARRRIDAWAGRLRLDPVLDRLAATLSSGVRQRLALACSVMHGPRVLFLDEPTAGVDLLTRREFWGLMSEFARDGATILVTTHYLDEVEHCSRLAFIDEGNIVADGTPDEIRHLPISGSLVEIACERPIAALAVVEGHPAVREAALFGSRIHARLDRLDALDDVARELAREGYGVSRADEVLPSLEDIFVYLVEQREARG